MHISVVAWTADGRISKYREFATKAEADAHVASVSARFPGAFATEYPAGPVREWKIDPLAKSISLEPVVLTQEEVLREKMSELHRTDLNLIRAIEDVIDIMAVTVPPVVADLIARRKALRQEISK